MCRSIFLLLVLANIVPYLLEGFQSKCYKDVVYAGSTRGLEYVDVDCDTDVCYSIDCPNSNKENSKGCGGECPEHQMRAYCKCSICSGNLCNKGEDKGSTKECLVGYNGKFEKEKCIFSNNDGCQTTECDNSGPGGDPLVSNIEKRCGKCPGWAGDNCKCTDCIGDLCNNNQPINKVVGKCYEALNEFADPKVTVCPSNDCFSVKCSSSPGSAMGCGTCSNHASEGPGCNCIDCKGELCNQPVNKGNINQCYGHQNDVRRGGKYETVNCTFFNNDGCHTMYCDGYDKKSCGKCPPPEELDGCKCVECTEGDMCNKPVTVNQCYWGVDQKGYEALTCEADGYNNKGCQKISCLNRVNKSIRINSTVYRDCGKCTNVPDPDKCKCFDCNDGDLCNASGRIGSSSFVVVLVIFGGVVVFLAMKPLVGIGI